VVSVFWLAVLLIAAAITAKIDSAIITSIRVKPDEVRLNLILLKM